MPSTKAETVKAETATRTIPLPSHYVPLLTPEAMERRVREIAAEITPWAESVQQTTGQQVLALCVLRGGAIFYTDLIRALPVSVEQAFCKAKSYQDNAQSERGVHLNIYDAPVKDRTILLVDDICDTGATLSALKKELIKRGAVDVKEATLVYRKIPNSSYRPVWAGVTFEGPEWLVGSGLDDCNTNSNLPGVYLMEGTGTAE